MTEVVIASDEAEGSRLAALIVAAQIRTKPNCVLGVATGSSPLALYEELAAQKRTFDASGIRAFALDEYVGIAPTHPQAYRAVLLRTFMRPLGLNESALSVPAVEPFTLERTGVDYEQRITDAGGIDLQILGIGTDGHIGFNEPGSSLASLTRVKTLTSQTRADNARFFDPPDSVPVHCVTQGIGTILRAKHLLLLAFGETKARALAAAVEGPVTASVPASAIQLHPHVTVVVDEAAARELLNADYYRYAYEHQPSPARGRT
ncbi:glucosamine-6-phosphate deaminase [Subtercola lobariae]|uniref:Glucosamine-6-phosphate deaminase n=1 Tax=Subtercola lobariae TaxID=1588641 RepID=A0A917B0V7_9MICO|nr:glucosamine-6-phosphate deaminase [Subtercola lobariae]GGF10400.1 glucosamine-6-phosphate deaminase [Subtercola lobariae]